VSVRLEIEGHVARVTIDRPDKLNAVDAATEAALEATWRRLEGERDVRAIVLTGAGDRAFCAGADLSGASKSGIDYWLEPRPHGFGGISFRDTLDIPVIGRVNGHALGGGFELALACDVIIAADTASFGLTEPRVGLAALGGGIQRIVQELGPKRAHALLLTARRISAAQAHDMGLVAEVVPAAELMDAARGWAGEMLECSPASLMATKAVIQSYIDDGLEASNKNMFALPEVKALLTGPDAREGPKAFAEKRKPNWADPS